MAEIVFLSHTPRSSEFRVGSHHLSSALARSGHEVAHVSTPFSALHEVLRPGQVSRREAARQGPTVVDGVIDLVPRTVLPANMAWTSRQMAHALELVGIPRPDFVFVDQPLFQARSLPATNVVFRPTDVFRARGLQRGAEEFARAANATVATSPGVLASVRVPESRPSTVIENGVDYESFSACRGLPKEYDFVYVGALDFRFDFTELRRAAERSPELRFVVYGPTSDPPPLPANVELRGSIKYADVPRALSIARVGIMPFVKDGSNSSRSPMKLYEYIAAGLPVVAPQPIARRAHGLGSVVGYDWEIPGSFGAAAITAINSRSVSLSDRRVAESKDWKTVAAELMSFAESVAR